LVGALPYHFAGFFCRRCGPWFGACAQSRAFLIGAGVAGEARTFVSGGGCLACAVPDPRAGGALAAAADRLWIVLSSLRNLRGVDPGFSKSNVLIASINPALNGYEPEKTRAFYNELLAGLRSSPGVQAASLATDSPISGGWDMNGIVAEGYQPRPGERTGLPVAAVSTDYFRALGISLVAVAISLSRTRPGRPVAIINERMAHQFFGNTNPIGKKIGMDNVPDTVIVGVSGMLSIAVCVNLRSGIFISRSIRSRAADLTMLIKTTRNPLLSLSWYARRCRSSIHICLCSE